MTLEQILARELELRECLLRDAWEDDRDVQNVTSIGLAMVDRKHSRHDDKGFACDDIEPGPMPLFWALEELRLVERRIFQTREAIKQAEEDARVAK